jgi:hypothetical protein
LSALTKFWTYFGKFTIQPPGIAKASCNLFPSAETDSRVVIRWGCRNPVSLSHIFCGERQAVILLFHSVLNSLVFRMTIRRRLLENR